MHNLRQYTVPLQRYMALMDLQVSDSSFEFMFSCGNCVQRFVRWWLNVCESCRKGTRGCSISFWLITSRSYFQSCTHQQLVRLARSMGASSGSHRVSTSAWKRSVFSISLSLYQVTSILFLWDTKVNVCSLGARFLKCWRTGLREGFKLSLLLMVSGFSVWEILVAR